MSREYVYGYPDKGDNDTIIIIIIIITTVIWTTGRNSKSYIKYLRNLPGMHDIKDLQQIAILCTARTYIGKC